MAFQSVGSLHIPWGNVTGKPGTFPPSSHTHNYAGSSSAGGAATSANKLNTNAGNASQPVYFSNGVPVAATAYSNAITQGLKVDDSRNDNPAPNSVSFTKQALTVDFKYNDKIGSPTGFSGSYCGVLSLAPWSETSGGNGYQIAVGYNGNAHPRLAIRSADLSATSWGTWYKIYTSDDKPTPAEIGAATSGHTHSNYLTTSGTAAAATKLATARTIALSGDVTGSTSFNGTTNVTISATVANDSHTHSDSTITSVGAGKITGTLAIAHGGTGGTTAAAARGNLGAMGAASANGYYGMTTPNGDTGDWIRTTTNGIIPYQSGGSGSLGSDTWFFNKAHIRSINLRNALDATATSSSTSYSASLDFKDKNGIAMGDIQCSKQPSNRNAIQVEATRTIGSTTYYNSIRWMVDNTGGLSYSLSSPAAFRNVLGLGNTSGALPVANGGTGATARGGAHTSSGLLYKIGLQAGTGSAPSSGNAGMVYIQYS